MNNPRKKFLGLYNEFSDEIYRFIVFKLSDRERAKDVLQEVFTRIWVYISKKGKMENARAFIYKTARNAVIDEYRRHSRRQSRNESLEELSQGGYEPGFDEIEEIMNKIDGEKVMELINELPEVSAEIMFLRYAENKSIPEIAEIVGRSPNAVSVYLSRGIRRLKKIIAEKYGGLL